MNIKVKGINIEITEAIENYAEKKASEALEKFSSLSGGNILAEVELSKTSGHHNNGEIYKTSIIVHGLAKNVFVEAVKDDLYAAIDEAKEKLENRLAEAKDKKKTISNKLALKFKNLFKNGK